MLHAGRTWLHRAEQPCFSVEHFTLITLSLAGKINKSQSSRDVKRRRALGVGTRRAVSLPAASPAGPAAPQDASDTNQQRAAPLSRADTHTKGSYLTYLHSAGALDTQDPSRSKAAALSTRLPVCCITRALILYL